jgi:hypothetical protein
MIELYHGTLATNVQQIETVGLLPRKGSWAAKFYPQASELVYAVAENRKGRLIVIIAGQMAKSGLIKWSTEYRFGDFNNDLVRHAAVVVVGQATFRHYPGAFESGHPPGAEPGDWYSHEPITKEHIRRIIVGEELLEWIRPNEMDFTHRIRDMLQTECAC